MTDVTRTFPPGGPWAYFKVYCGEMAADAILHNEIARVVDALAADGAITHWFFIRYVDPAHHLRVRFHLADTAGWSTLLARVKDALDEKVRDGLVWRMQFDTYERELERYGPDTMELSERLFHRESALVLGALGLVHESADESLRWLFGLLAIERLLDDFGYDKRRQVDFLDRMRDAMLREYRDPKALREQINQKSRAERDRIVLASEGFLALLQEWSRATEQDRRELLQRAGEGRLDVPLDALVGSYLHMFCNRLFPTRQRLHELVLYSFLAKQQRGRLARQGS